MIYVTPYDLTTLQCTGPSTDSGFTALDEVRQMMGEPDMAHAKMLTYGETCFSDMVLRLEIDTPVILCNTAANSARES